MKTHAQIRKILDSIKFFDRTFRLLEKGDGYLLQLEYLEPDVTEEDARAPSLQRARKWYVSPHATETEIVETAFAACLRSMNHVVGEHFTYRGRRVYSPHLDIDARIELCDGKRFDGRPPPPKASRAKKSTTRTAAKKK